MELNISSYVLSDHFPVAITRKCNHSIVTKPYHNYIIYRSVKNFSEIEFLKDLSNQHWSSLTDCANPDECAILVKDIFPQFYKHLQLLKEKAS